MSFKNAGFLSQEVEKLIMKTRKAVSNFINSNSEEIIFTKNTTDSLNIISNILAKEIQPGDEIITSQMEHNSSLFPWLKIAREKKLKLFLFL